jgi:hypothetical protein
VHRKARAHTWRLAKRVRPGLHTSAIVRPLRTARSRESQGACNSRARGSRRSSPSGGGDSGDPGDPDPPGEQSSPAGRETAERTCLNCGKSIEHRAPQARFCEGDACRKAFTRAEAKVATDSVCALASLSVHELAPPDVDPEVQEIFDLETNGRFVRDAKRKHLSWRPAVMA